MAEINLSKYGITGTTEIVYNPSYETLFEEETKPELEGYEKGHESELEMCIRDRHNPHVSVQGCLHNPRNLYLQKSYLHEYICGPEPCSLYKLQFQPVFHEVADAPMFYLKHEK